MTTKAQEDTERQMVNAAICPQLKAHKDIDSTDDYIVRLASIVITASPSS